MSNSGYTTTPPGWYPDPAGSPRTRWWDGTQWTETYADAASAPTGYTTGAAPYTYAQPGVLRAPAGTSPSTIWIWLMALVPLLTIAYAIFAASSGEFAAILDEMDSTSTSSLATSTAFTSGSLASSVISWIAIGANILLAGLDWHALKTAGVPKPFHWTWGLFAIISVPVYIIGRTVVAKRRTGAGLAPLFVYIGTLVLSFIVTLVIVLVALGPELATLSR